MKDGDVEGTNLISAIRLRQKVVDSRQHTVNVCMCAVNTTQILHIFRMSVCLLKKHNVLNETCHNIFFSYKMPHVCSLHVEGE